MQRRNRDIMIDQTIIQQLKQNRDAADEQLQVLIEREEANTPLAAAADEVRRAHYGTEVYLRGLIEFTNVCKNNCYYCGIRAGNHTVKRYSLTREEILDCCAEGYALGFRTFVLQGGENPAYTDTEICRIVAEIRSRFPDCAITLSIGEKPRASYQAYFDAGANRYLLRHETANEVHYARLHPAEMSLANRKRCLWDLKEIGYQVGAGFMVGAPYETTAHLIEDLRFLQELQPDMIGIGPYLPHQQTPFRDCQSGTLSQTLRMLSILRLMFPYALIPATTALGTISPIGRELGLKAGANVVMPNLSPVRVRKQYELYDDKICTGEEAAQCRGCLARRVSNAGYQIVSSRGDVRREIEE